MPCWDGKNATFRISVYCTSSITRKAPWISPFFSSKYEEASWSWCFWVIWVKRKKKVNVYLKKSASVCLLHKTMMTRWSERIVSLCGHRHVTQVRALLLLPPPPSSYTAFVSQLAVLPPPALKSFLKKSINQDQGQTIVKIFIKGRNNCSPSASQILAALLSKNPRPMISYTFNILININTANLHSAVTQ